MTEPTRDSDELLDEERPGADPGAAYDRAADDGQIERDESEPSPGVGEVYRSGS